MTTPTQAQIEAALVAFVDAKGIFPGNRKVAITAALTAAAQVGTEEEENHRMGFVSATASDGNKWDRWYASLPSDLRRKLSLHDFKRLGDCFAAAQVGEPDIEEKEIQDIAEEYGLDPVRDLIGPAMINATIERCAQVAETYSKTYSNGAAVIIAAAIRKLKDPPLIDPLIQHPATIGALGGPFPEEAG